MFFCFLMFDCEMFQKFSVYHNVYLVLMYHECLHIWFWFDKITQGPIHLFSAALWRLVSANTVCYRRPWDVVESSVKSQEVDLEVRLFIYLFKDFLGGVFAFIIMSVKLAGNGRKMAEKGHRPESNPGPLQQELSPLHMGCSLHQVSPAEPRWDYFVSNYCEL